MMQSRPVTPKQKPPRLAETHPQIASKWHPELNGDLTAWDLTYTDHRKVWWLCDEHHAFQKTVNKQVRNDRFCPECIHLKGNFSINFPHLIEQISDKNINLDISLLLHRSDKRIWWKCPTGEHPDYLMSMIVKTKSTRPKDCPVCNGFLPSKETSLAGQYPELLKEWDYKNNKGLDPFDLSPGSNAKVWWICQKNPEHRWHTPIYLRSRRSAKCPYCRGIYADNEHRLSIVRPDLSAEWHRSKNRHLWLKIQGTFKDRGNRAIPSHLKEKNRFLRPRDLSINSYEIVWWKCPVDGTIWRDRVVNRTKKGKGCPTCTSKSFVQNESIAALFPGRIKLWHPSRNLPELPEQFSKGSNRSVWWRCPKSATHVWQAKICNIVRAWANENSGCPWCYGKKVDEHNSLAALNPDLAKNWHPTANGDLTPSKVTAHSGKKVWWLCSKAGHTYQYSVTGQSQRQQQQHELCPDCSHVAINEKTSLAGVSPQAAAMWHPRKNGKLTASDVHAGNTVSKFWWRCPQKHEWMASVPHMVISAAKPNKSKGCPYCCGKKATIQNNLYSLNYKLAQMWDVERNAPVQSWDVLPLSKKMAHWLCPNGHRFEQTIANVSRSFAANGDKCYLCAKEERKAAKGSSNP